MSKHAERVELTARFLEGLPQQVGLPMEVHWDSGWRGEERIVQYALDAGHQLKGLAELFIEGSSEMDIRIILQFGVTNAEYSKLWLHWWPDDLRPVELAWKALLECPAEMSLEIEDSKSLAAALAVVKDFSAQSGVPWIRVHACESGMLEAMAQQRASDSNTREKIDIMEREVVLRASRGDRRDALDVFDQSLWPLVAADGERMILERWRRLRSILEEME